MSYDECIELMSDQLTITIDRAHFSEGNPSDRTYLYCLLLGAVADLASEIRFESDTSLGRVLYVVEGVEYEMSPISKEVAERELLLIIGAEKNPTEQRSKRGHPDIESWFGDNERSCSLSSCVPGSTIL